jgi:hypothetical protein
MVAFGSFGKTEFPHVPAYIQEISGLLIGCLLWNRCVGLSFPLHFAQNVLYMMT